MIIAALPRVIGKSPIPAARPAGGRCLSRRCLGVSANRRSRPPDLPDDRHQAVADGLSRLLAIVDLISAALPIHLAGAVRAADLEESDGGRSNRTDRQGSSLRRR